MTASFASVPLPFSLLLMADWDEHYRRGGHADQEPLPLLARLVPQLAPGRALDLACGAGRHALLLAEHGWQVTAVDASRVAIEIVRARARERGVSVDARLADLERSEFVIEPDAYDLICVCHYLQRDLFPHIRAGARAGGRVIAVIHLVDGAPGIKPMNPAFLLQPGELRAEFAGWEILHDREGRAPEDPARRATAEIIARRIA
jgi:tellurite methyltransferase